MKVLVNGAGIGGLTLALMLHARGIACEIYEAAPELRELGVGINVLPHAIRELAELGLLDELDRLAIRTRELRYLTRRGQEIWRELRGVDGGHDYPQFSIHRGRLHMMLRDAVRDRLGGGAIHLSKRGVGFEQEADGVTLRFEDGSAARGDVLVAADGIHSPIRRQLFPDEAGLRWNGVMMWRGAVETEAFGDGREMIIAGGFTYKLVLYPIAAGDRPGRVLLNWVVTYRPGADGAPAPRREDWNRQGTLEELLPHVRAFNVDVIDLEALVKATPVFLEYPMCDRDPLPRWSHGRVTLLGDAAHPMYPVGSNGASQAILDGRALADALAAGGDPVEALAGYDAVRRPLTAEVVTLNRRGGPEGVIDEVERRAPDGCDDLDAVISLEERAAIVRGYAAKAGYAAGQTRMRGEQHPSATINDQQQEGNQMTVFAPGVMTSDASLGDIAWHILGQTYTPKYRSDSSMAWHAVLPAGTFVPPHIHTTQDEFVYVLTGEMTCEIDGKTLTAKPGDLICMPKNIPHGLFNRSGGETTCIFWVSPTAKLWELFVNIDGVPDPAEVVRLAALHEVDFLPPPGE